MNLWQMLMARRGLMDVAESHERGGAGAGAPAGAEEQGTQESGKQNGLKLSKPQKTHAVRRSKLNWNAAVNSML